MTNWSTVIHSPDDLVTSPEKTRKGFISLAMEKTSQASDFVDEAKHLRNLLQPIASPHELWSKLGSKQAALLTAAGVSEKARKHLGAGDGEQIFAEFTERFLIPAQASFKDELVYRFLLTRGDTLGGKMRNIAGRIGRKIINRRLLCALRMNEMDYSTFPSITGDHRPSLDEDEEDRINALKWKTAKGATRVLLYDRKVPVIQKNVDFVVLEGNNIRDKLPSEAKHYIALGEMKAGFDSAGADEHWKTASHALLRIREGFKKEGEAPCLFFVGASIVNNMAREIYQELQENKLQNAANLLDDKQISMICEWLLGL